VRERRSIALRYAEAFSDMPGITFMPQATYGLHTNWLSCFLIDEEQFGCSRDQLIAELNTKNIETRPVWKPMHMQPLYRTAEHWEGSVSEDLFERGICLPSSSSLSEKEQDYVIEHVARVARRRLLRTERVA
jgi:pyridoxal phosphate-dependent aminotransferase EpsN